MSRFGLITKRCKEPNKSELECYKKIYINNNDAIVIWGNKQGQGVYIQMFDRKNDFRWYTLINRLPGDKQ